MTVPNAALFAAASTIVDSMFDVPSGDLPFSDFKALEDALEVTSAAMLAVNGVINAFKVFVPSAPAFSTCTCDECEFGWDNS